jgi:2-methylcitrate dehydratase
VTLDDGSVLEKEVAFPPGHDENPLNDAQLATKFHGLADPVLGAGRATELWERLSHLQDDPRPHEAIGLVTAS